MCVPAQPQRRVRFMVPEVEEIFDHPRWMSEEEPKYRFDGSEASPDERAKLTRTPNGQWRKQIEKPVVPQPTGISNPPPTPPTALQIEGRVILEELIRMLPLFDAANNPTHSTTPPEETGSPNLYPSLAEMEQEDNRSPDSDHLDSPPTSDATPPVLQARQSVVLSTSNPPPYEWKAKCAHCTQEIGFNEGPQYKCSTCPNYFLCDICQDIIMYLQNS